jgi:CheY-like chemotaxis protein
MDVRMPGTDGLTATRRLRSEPGPNQRTPILALTADIQPDDIEACRAAGMDDHVAKPVAVADLISKAILWATPSADIAAEGAPS